MRRAEEPGPSGERPSREPIRVGIFGNGFARQVILPCLRHVEGVRVVGISSPHAERVRQTAADFGIVLAATDHREILTSAKPQLVFIATPPHRHAEMAIDALEAGCHVVCEKPMALSCAESARMTAAASRRPNQLALIDHELRFHPSRHSLREIVRRGELGEIRHAAYTLHSPTRRDPALPWTWWSDAAQGGGALGAIGSHAIDALHVLVGEVAGVRGLLHTFVAERIDPISGGLRRVTADDAAFAWLRFRSGAIGTLSLSMVEGARVHKLSLAGSEGAATIEEQGPLRVGLGRDPWTERSLPRLIPSAEELKIPDTDWACAFLIMARRILEAIRAGSTEIPEAATFEDGHRTQIALDAIRRSAQSDRWTEIAAIGASSDTA